MTEGVIVRHEKPMCVRVCLEVGHACAPRRSALGGALALDWRVWVRGARGDISSLVHKVVFHLRPPSAFVYPKRVVQEPPYEIQESGCASIDIPIRVYLKHSAEPRKLRLRYRLRLRHDMAGSESRCMYYDFANPAPPLCAALLRAGGEPLSRAPPAPPPRRVRAELTRQLRAADMTQDEAAVATQLFLSYSSYERCAQALPLPPASDPIYSLPELPPALRAALASVEAHYSATTR